jgi:hypothetical protein
MTTFAERIVVLHQAFAEAHIGHGFGGAVALAYHVLEPRNTRDIDINVSVPTEEAAKVLGALPAGIAFESDTSAVIVRDGQVRLWWDGRDGIPVDIFFPQHPFHEQVGSAIRLVPFLDTEIPIISATHLTVFKTLFNRSRDWPDIEAMVEAGSVDGDEALSWVDRLVGPSSDVYLRLEQVLTSTRPAAPGPDAPVLDSKALGQ